MKAYDIYQEYLNTPQYYYFNKKYIVAYVSITRSNNHNSLNMWTIKPVDSDINYNNVDIYHGEVQSIIPPAIQVWELTEGATEEDFEDLYDIR